MFKIIHFVPTQLKFMYNKMRVNDIPCQTIKRAGWYNHRQ